MPEPRTDGGLEARYQREREDARVWIVRQAIPQNAIHAALRTINLHLYQHGLHPTDILVWSKSACWFPQLCDPVHPDLALLRDHALEAADAPAHDEVWTQIILHFPHQGPPHEPAYHVDNPPPDGRAFTGIIGIPLTPSDEQHGGIRFPHSTPKLAPGDIISFDPNTPHSGGLNLSGAIRYCVYLRFVADFRDTS